MGSGSESIDPRDDTKSRVVRKKVVAVKEREHQKKVSKEKQKEYAKNAIKRKHAKEAAANFYGF